MRNILIQANYDLVSIKEEEVSKQAEICKEAFRREGNQGCAGEAGLIYTGRGLDNCSADS